MRQLLWTLGAAGLGWFASLQTYSAAQQQMQQEIQKMQEMHAVELKLLGAIAMHDGISDQYIAAISSLAAPTSGARP